MKHAFIALVAGFLFFSACSNSAKPQTDETPNPAVSTAVQQPTADESEEIYHEVPTNEATTEKITFT